MMDRFHYLGLGLSVILIFVGVKMAAVDLVRLPSAISLAIIGVILAVSIVASLLRPPRPERISGV
jgi:tellurite resistance protein TerC